MASAVPLLRQCSPGFRKHEAEEKPEITEDGKRVLEQMYASESARRSEAALKRRKTE